MSSESSFDAQLFNEFDNFVRKPSSTDSDCFPSDPESPHEAISSQGTLLPTTTSYQTSILHQQLGFRSSSLFPLGPIYFPLGSLVLL